MDKNQFNALIEKMKTAKDKNGNLLEMDSIFITYGEKEFRHFFNDQHSPNDLRSISKPIIAMALGIALDKGLTLRGKKLTLETLIYPFFKDKILFTNPNNTEKIKKVTLRHLLTHTIGFDDGLLFSKDIKNRDLFTLLDYVLNYDIVHEPGTHFVYSNAGPYIISVLIQEELGINLSDWVSDTLFQKINITDFEWKNYGNYCAAATGLKIKHEDLHKIGKILLNNGTFNGLPLVPGHWVEKMTTVQVRTPSMYDITRVFPKFGYGFYIYLCENGTYYIDGTDGQYLIVIPDKKMLITTFGHQSDMKPITECFRSLL